MNKVLSDGILLFIVYVGLFVLFYSEPIGVGLLKVALVWKFFLFTILLFFVILNRVILVNNLVIITLLLSVKNVLSLGALEEPVESFLAMSRMLTIPILSIGFYSIYRKNKNALKSINSIIFNFPIFIALSTVPFHLGLLNELGRLKELDSFGVSETMFTGMFQNPHSASITFAISILIGIWCLLRQQVNNKKTLLFSIVILLYSLYETYARTGLLVLVIGLLPIIYTYRYNLKIQIVFYISIGFTIFMVSSSELFMNRLLDQRSYGTVSLMELGSGRPLIWATSLLYWFDSSLEGVIFGVGETFLKEHMQAVLGLRIFSHNGFIDALVINGLIGFTFILVFFYILKREICITGDSDFDILGKVIFLSYFTYYFFQGSNYFLVDLLVVILLLRKEFAKTV